MKKNLLKEQYARLFKGRSSSNDASLITEASITEASIKVLRHGENHYEKLIFTLKANGKTYKVATGDTDWMEWHFMDDQNQSISPSAIARQNPKDVFTAIEKYVKDNEDEINRVYGMDKYTGLTSISTSTGTQGPLKIYGSGPGKIEVKDHDDMREPSDNDSGYEGEVEYEGTWDGEKWSATQEFLGDGAIFTTVYDANDGNVEDESIDVYDEIIDAINDYMDKEGLNENKRMTKKANLLKEQYARLFKGKSMSNDASLIAEAVGSLKHHYDEDGILVITGKMGVTPFEVATGGPQGTEDPGISGHKGGWRYYKNFHGNIWTAIDNDKLEPELITAIQQYVEQKGLSWQSGKGQRTAGDEVEYFEEPVSAFLKGDLGTVEGYPVNSITLHYWGTVVNLNANIDGLEDYYMDDWLIEYLQDKVDGMKGNPEYRNWIKEIEAMGHHSAKDIGGALDGVEYTESGMNQDGDVSTEYSLD